MQYKILVCRECQQPLMSVITERSQAGFICLAHDEPRFMDPSSDDITGMVVPEDFLKELSVQIVLIKIEDRGEKLN